MRLIYISLDWVQRVVGGWWYPEDAQVDNRALVRALWTAAQSLGVDVRDRITVEAIQQQQHGHWCSNLSWSAPNTMFWQRVRG